MRKITAIMIMALMMLGAFMSIASIPPESSPAHIQTAYHGRYTPAADTYCDQANAGTNYGTSGTMTAREASEAMTKIAFMRWDLSAIPVGATLTDVHLNVYVSAASTTATLIIYDMERTAWGETSMVWTNKIVTDASGMYVGVTGEGTTTGWKNYSDDNYGSGHNLIDMVADSFANHGRVASLSMQFTGTGTYVRDYSTKEGSYVPYLYIAYTYTAPNWKPAFTSSPTIVTNNNTAYSYAVTTNETCTGWTLTTNASFLSLGAVNHTIYGRPTSGLASYYVRVNVTSSAGKLIQWQNYTLNVRKWNPTFSSSGTTSVNNNSAYSYTATANETVTWTYADNAAWLYWGTANHTVYGRPSLGLHTYNVWINITNAVGGKAYQTFTVFVKQWNPAFTNSGTTAVLVGSAYSYTATANETVTWVYTTNSTWSSWGAGNHTVYGRPLIASSCWVKLVITNAVGGTATQNWTIYVGIWSPIITSTPITGIANNTLYTYSLTVNESVTWYENDNVPGTIALVGTDVTGTPNIAGAYWIYVRATNGLGGTASQNFTLNVGIWNPTFTNSGTTTVAYNHAYSYTATANETCTWSATTNASWIQFGVANHTVYGRATTYGQYWVKIHIVNAVSGATDQNYTIAVTRWKPTITSTPFTNGWQDTLYEYIVTANMSCTFTMSTNASFLSLVTDYISGIPLTSPASYYINIKATNTIGGFIWQNYTLTVHVPTTPTWSPAKYITADATVKSGTPNTKYGTDNNLQVYHDSGGANNFVYLRWNLTGVPTGTVITSAQLHIWESTHYSGAKIWIMAGNPVDWSETGICWNNQPGYGSSVDYFMSYYWGGEHNLTSASLTSVINSQFQSYGKVYLVLVYGTSYTNAIFDSKESTNDPYLRLEYTQQMTWQPTFTSSPITTIPHGDAYSYEATANHTCIFGMHTNAAWLNFSQPTSPSALCWVNGTAPFSIGTYWVNISAYSPSGSNYRFQNYTITVTDNAPTFTTSPTTTVKPRATYYYDANAVDVDGDPLTFGLSTDWSGLTINPATGELSKVAPSYNASYYIHISVTDGIKTTWQNYTLTVIGWAPKETSDYNYWLKGGVWTGGPGILSVTQAMTTFAFNGGVYWNETLQTVYTVINTNCSFLDSAYIPYGIYGLVNIFNLWFPDPSLILEGWYYVDLFVVGNGGIGHWYNYTLTVLPLDVTPPSADAGVDQTVDQHDIVTFDGSGSTDNVAVVNWTWTWTDVIAHTLYGVSPTHQFNNVGVFTVTLTVKDSESNSDTDTMTVTVLDVDPPVANAGGSKSTHAGSGGTATFTFNGGGSTDNVGVVNYSWTFQINGTGSVYHRYGVTFTFAFPDGSVSTIYLVVRDAAGNTDSDSCTVTVTAPINPAVTAGGILGIMAWIGLIGIIAIPAVAVVMTRREEGFEDKFKAVIAMIIMWAMCLGLFLAGISGL